MNGHARRFVILLLVFPIMSCASVQSNQERIIPFKELEYISYKKKGIKKICGRAYYVTRQGEEKYRAGYEVILKPVTTYSTEWFQERVLAEKDLSPPSLQARQYNRSTITDEDGRFCFEAVPAGQYYLASYILWAHTHRMG